MTIWFTADQHLGHDSIRRYTNRPFATVDEMDFDLIHRHNAVVQHGDTVYMLGDFTLSGGERAARYLSLLRGEIMIIPGGHDAWTHKKRIYISADHVAVQILDPLVVLEVDDGCWLTLCHYPMRSWERSSYGMHHLHGHSHGAIGKFYRSSNRQLPSGQYVGMAMDVGVDSNDFAPVSLESVIEQLNVAAKE